ncbi:hypothetical protein [Vibrio sp. OPT18]|uniref:hypothetical protein n=1 Tax=Vibrio sp. OPT18 TaxID=2778641 RepID=UPI001880B956|nr:hypothetical protein [Vibrio sp. OPT18]MBE8577432.1 hypothetical protein [Vibrio sp. OPT18]
MKPEEIYLLLCLVKNKGINAEFSHQSVELSKQFGVTLNTVTSLFSALKHTQSLIVKERYSLKGRGQNDYMFTEKILSHHNHSTLLQTIIASQNPAISRLLSNDLSNLIEPKSLPILEHDSPQKRQSFRASNRLFLTLLLLHSNELGVIETLSSMLIRKMMGNISADRFKSQLNTLKKMGLVECHISGMTGKVLFGRMKGSYYLNTQHPFLKDSFNEVSSLLLDFNQVLYEHNESTEVTCLLHAYRDTRNGYGQETNQGKLDAYLWPDVMGDSLKDLSTSPVIHFFNDKALHNPIHQWVCQVASELILHPFDTVHDVIINQCSDKLVQLLSPSQSIPLTKLPSVIVQVPSHHQQSNDLSFLHDVLSVDNRQQEATLTYWQHVALTRLILTLGLNMASRYKELLKLKGVDAQYIKQCIVTPSATFEKPCFHYKVLFTLKEGKPKNIKLLVSKDEEVTLLIAERAQDVNPKISLQDIKKIFVPKSEPQHS